MQEIPPESGASPLCAMAEASFDHLLGGRVAFFQPRRGYRAAIDPVLLAAATAAAAGESVLDLGCGAGAASLCLASRVPESRLTGLEIQPDLAALARANAEANGLGGRFQVHEGDLRRPPPHLATAGFDRVMANPPFLRPGHHTPSPSAGRAVAHGEFEAGLEQWLACAARLLKPRGTLTLIHRADRLDEILSLLHNRFGEVTICPLWPRAGVPARRVLVAARLAVRSPARLLAGLVLHAEDGAWTAQADRLLRHGDALPFT
jgi:tRNA1(Val) A37 N6-methylase TrmN6